MHPDVIAEVSAGAIRRNVERIRRVCGEATGVCAVLKADAYGHGLRAVLPALADNANVQLAAVTSLNEAIELRDNGWRRQIICLGQPLGIGQSGERAERIASIIEYDIIVSVGDLQDVRDLGRAAEKQQRSATVQINVETGMGRLGVLADEAIVLAQAVIADPSLELHSVFTHLAVAECRDNAHNPLQLERFAALREQLAAAGVRPPHLHAANSPGAFAWPDARFDFVRTGLAMYGYRLNEEAPRPEPLEPCLRVRSHVVMCKTIPAGHPVGYGCTFIARRPTRVGIVPIGYSDGYRRSLSNRMVMGVRGGDAPVIGTVSMDLTAIDLTAFPTASVGERVTIIDERPHCDNSVESIARRLNTVPYEVTCLLGQRIARVSVGEFSDAGQPAH